LILEALTFTLILGAECMRGGISYFDAFFPVAVLNLKQ
jgi:hypothetical protein